MKAQDIKQSAVSAYSRNVLVGDWDSLETDFNYTAGLIDEIAAQRNRGLLDAVYQAYDMEQLSLNELNAWMEVV
jgi:hypothetical protein